MINLSMDIYPCVAKKFNTSVNNVKCNILRASNYSFCECEIHKFEKYFGLLGVKKPNSKTIIFTVLRHLNNLDI